MRTLEIKKTATGQYQYRITEGGVEIVPTQYGAFSLDSTTRQAMDRYRVDDIIDLTECKVAFLSGGKMKTATMTKDCFDRTTRTSGIDRSSGQFLGRIIEMAGAPVQDEVPF